MRSRVIAVIPVKGRLALLKITLQRLFNRNGIDHIICIGETNDERYICQQSGAQFIKFPNEPLGRKWNEGFLKAKEHHPDFIVYLGSSDWISDNWLQVIIPLSEKFDMVGKSDFNMLHINQKLTLANWPGYQLGSNREYEPIGIGRILNSNWLDKIDWMPFDDNLNKSMDYSMYKKLKSGRDKLMIFNSPEVQSLSISCDKWSNLHAGNFNLKTISFREPEVWLKMWFPEALNLIL